MPNRREIIKALMLGAGTLTLGPFLNALKPLAVHAAAADEVDNNNFFVEGVINSISGNSLLVNANGGVNKILVTTATDIWKGHHGMDLSSLKVGDHIFARGVRVDNILTTVVIWANIVNIKGSVTKKEKSKLTIKDHNGENHMVDINIKTEMLDGFVPLLPSERDSSIEVGSSLYVIGVFDMASKEVTATRVFVPQRNQKPQPAKR